MLSQHRLARFPLRVRRFLALSALMFVIGPVGHAYGDATYKYPRLGLYGHVQGSGWPIIGPGGSVDMNLAEIVSRYDAVIIPATPFTEYRPDVLQSFRAMHPGIKLYAYVQADYAWLAQQPDSTVHLPTRQCKLVRDLGGYLYDKHGGEFADANVNLAKKNAQGRFVVAEALADYFAQAIGNTGRWDGMFFDRYCQSILWQQTPAESIDYVRAGYASLAAFDVGWRAGTDTLAARVRRNVGALPVLIGNCGQGLQYGACNGWMRENFPYQNGGTWETNMFNAPGGYMTDEAAFRAPASNWLVSWVTDASQPYSRENARRVRYGLGTAALGDGYGTFNPPDLDVSTNYQSWWYDEYAVDLQTGRSTNDRADTGWLGHALGPYYKMFWAGHDDYDAVDNPGFETNLLSWSLTSTVGATLTRDLTTHAVGIASARVHLPSPGIGATSTILATTGRGVPLLSQTVYSATFWARAQSPRSITIAEVNATTGATFAYQIITIDATWRNYQVQMVSQEFGLAQLQFRLGGSAVEVWIDEAHLQRGASSVYRRDFENGIVLVNPNAQVSVVLEQPYRRILGSVDPLTNDGLTLTETLVNGSDALFLMRPGIDPVGVPPGAGAGPGVRPAWTGLSPNPAFAGQAMHATLETPRGGRATVGVYDAAGRHVRALYDGVVGAGTRAFVWDGNDEAGRAAPAGMYFLRATVDGMHATRKIVRT